jgi:hypothetical protein
MPAYPPGYGRNKVGIYNNQVLLKDGFSGGGDTGPERVRIVNGSGSEIENGCNCCLFCKRTPRILRATFTGVTLCTSCVTGGFGFSFGPDSGTPGTFSGSFDLVFDTIVNPTPPNPCYWRYNATNTIWKYNTWNTNTCTGTVVAVNANLFIFAYMIVDANIAVNAILQATSGATSDIQFFTSSSGVGVWNDCTTGTTVNLNNIWAYGCGGTDSIAVLHAGSVGLTPIW